MRRRGVVMILQGAAAVWSAAALVVAGAALAGSAPEAAGAVAAGAAGRGAVPAVWGAARAAGSWGRAIEVPGLGALNKGGNASVSSVSCASAGNCAAGGYYTNSHGQQGFVGAERNGVWGRATGVPGLGSLNAGGYAQVNSMSCASAGNCAAGGYYEDRRFDLQGFVAAERNGRWGRAIEVPGLGALNAGAGLNVGAGAAVSSVSCASAGSCAAGGYYEDHHGNEQGFVAAERHGVWGRAIEVPGLGTLNKGGQAQVTSVSCGAAGNCAAGGTYTDSTAGGQGFVAAERHGRWGRAIEVPGLAALSRHGVAEVTSVSCASAGNCAAGGTYFVSGGGWQGFVVAERHGVWHKAIKMPGLVALNKGRFAEVTTVSCASAGSCAAGGDYLGRFHHPQGFVAAERNGAWGRAIEVPGLAALNTGRVAEVTSVSCGPVGSCVAGGFYFDRSRHLQLFVANQNNGVWGTAIEVPGLAALNTGVEVGSRASYFPTVSCTPAGACAAGGAYTDHSRHEQGFVVTQTR